MTLTSLMNFGYFGSTSPPSVPIERYHSDHHYYHGSRGSSKGNNGNGAALSALTLLAFLFLLNVMQQSMEQNNSTSTTTTTTLLLRDDTELPTILDQREDKNSKIDDNFIRMTNVYDSASRLVSKGYVQRKDERLDRFS